MNNKLTIVNISWLVLIISTAVLIITTAVLIFCLSRSLAIPTDTDDRFVQSAHLVMQAIYYLATLGLVAWLAHLLQQQWIREREYAHLKQLDQNAKDERETLRKTTAGNNQSVEIKDLVTLFKALEINDTKKTNEKEKEQINRIRREILKQIQDLTERVFEEIN